MGLQYGSFVGAGEIHIKESGSTPPSTHLWGVCKVYEDYRRCTSSYDTGSWSVNGSGPNYEEQDQNFEHEDLQFIFSSFTKLRRKLSQIWSQELSIVFVKIVLCLKLSNLI